VIQIQHWPNLSNGFQSLVVVGAMGFGGVGCTLERLSEAKFLSDIQ